MKKKVSIIIVNYNGEHFLKKCLASIKRQTYKNIEVVIVDNNSTDNSISFVKTFNPRCKIIRNKKNLGFAQPNNQGAKQATGEYLFLLNNDTELFPDSVEKLYDNYKNDCILTATQISTREKSAVRVGAGADIFGYPFQAQDAKKTKLFYADGAALFIKKEDFVKIGMFDSELFMFQEDIDFSWRARIMGYSIAPCRKAKLYHYYGGTANVQIDKTNKYVSSYFRRYLNERNIIRNILKNYSFPLVLFIFAILILFHIYEIVFFIITGKLKVVECYLAAYKWNVMKFKNTLSVRKRVQQKRALSDFAVMKYMYFMYSKLNILFRLGIPKFE